MRKKSVLGIALTIGVAGLMMTACSTANAATSGAQLIIETPPVAMASTIQTNIVPLAAIADYSQAEQAATTPEINSFVVPSITVTEAAWQYHQIPASAIPMEEAALIGAEYIWEVFRESIDGMYVNMVYMDCWMRPGAGRWTGSVQSTPQNDQWDRGQVLVPVANPVGRMFTFTVDSATGERMEIGSHSFTPPAPILHDTQPLWESTRGLEIQAMTDSQLATFVGLTPEQLDVYTQKATEFAEVHFANSTLQSVELGRNVTRPNGVMRLQGIQPLLDTDENGNIFGTLSGIEFTATDDDGREIVISISLLRDSIQIWSVL